MSIPLNPNQSHSGLNTLDKAENEKFTITCPAAAAATQADYFSYSEGDGDSVAVWLDKDGAGVAPTGAIYIAASRKIKVDILTGDISSQVAAKVKSAIDNGNNLEDFRAEVNGGDIIMVAKSMKNITDAVPHDAGDIGSGSFSIVIDQQGSLGLIKPSQKVDRISNRPK